MGKRNAAENWCRILGACIVTGGMLLAIAELTSIAGDKSGWVAAWFGFAINFLFLIWATVFLLALPVEFPPKYYAVPISDESSRICKYLGVAAFGKLMRGTNPFGKFSGGREGLLAFQQSTRSAETVHVVAAIGAMLFAVYLFARGRWDMSVWIVLFTVPSNAYPIMLQRFNRHRVENLLHRLYQQQVPNNLRRGHR